MKLTICILFCVILTLQFNGADAGEQKGLFGRIRGSAHKLKQDVNNLFNPDAKKQQEEESVIHFVEDESEEDSAAAWTARKPVEPTPVTNSSTTPAPTTIVPTTTAATDTTTEKDGRENFSGSCLTGFMRTPDGRCKPTF